MFNLFYVGFCVTDSWYKDSAIQWQIYLHLYI